MITVQIKFAEMVIILFKLDVMMETAFQEMVAVRIVKLKPILYVNKRI